MSEMVERVARALTAKMAEMVGAELRADGWHVTATNRTMTFMGDEIARAAIAAMREPTDEMRTYGLAALGPDRWIGDAWRAMIDEALR